MVADNSNINIVIIGHVDSGKSTTCGNLLVKLGAVDKRELEKYEKESAEMGKGSFKFAWTMDKLKAERQRGITIQINLKELKIKDRKMTIIDAPGHRDFIKNMITGASQADVGLVMISAAKGEFEAGISASGQTKEHVMLANTVGIRSLVVCVNKMDLAMDENNNPFCQKRYKEIKSYMKDFLIKLGYKKAAFQFIPISGFNGDNLYELSSRCPWYKGDHLTDILYKMETPKRPTGKPLRCPVQVVIRIPGIGPVFTGRVETGIMKKNMMVVFEPGVETKKKGEIKSMEKHRQPVDEALPGDNVGINVKNITYGDVQKGMVIGDASNSPPKECVSFKARVIILNHRGEITKGYSPVIHVHMAHVTCKLVNITDLFDRRNGKLLEKNPSSIKQDQGAIMEFIPQKRLVIETFKNFAPLGRFSIRDSKETVGVGVVTEVTFKD